MLHSQEQLQAAVENAQKRMNEAIRKAVTDVLIELNIGNSMERLDKRISTLTDKVTELETFVAANNDVSGSNTDGLLPEDTVYDANGNIDRASDKQDYDDVFAATRQVWVVSTTIKVIIIVCPMILMLRLSSQYLLFRVIMMLRDILIGR